MPNPGIVKFLWMIIGVALLISACYKVNEFFNLEQDNIAEEIAEDILEHQTGIKLDFTPDSKE